MAHVSFWDAARVDDLLHHPAPTTVATMVAGRMIRDTGVFA
jgi:hypothetical protein